MACQTLNCQYIHYTPVEYTYIIYVVLIIHGKLVLIDTHPISKDISGNGQGVLKVYPDCSYADICSCLREVDGPKNKKKEKLNLQLKPNRACSS